MPSAHCRAEYYYYEQQNQYIALIFSYYVSKPLELVYDNNPVAKQKKVVQKYLADN